MSNGMLSEHLSVAEYIATSHRDLLEAQERAWCSETQFTINAQRLAVEVFEPVRFVLAQPLHVTSGFRCKELNEKVGGKLDSYHRLALAIDVVPVDIDPRAALFVILHAVRKGQLPRLDKVIVEMGRWLHLQATMFSAVPAKQLVMETADGKVFASVT